VNVWDGVWTCMIRVMMCGDAWVYMMVHSGVGWCKVMFYGVRLCVMMYVWDGL